MNFTLLPPHHQYSKEEEVQNETGELENRQANKYLSWCGPFNSRFTVR